MRAYLALATEIRAATVVAARSGLTFGYSPETLSGSMRMTGPPAQQGQPDEDYLIGVEFDGFRAIPPLWLFLDPRNGKHVGPAGWPRAVSNSVLHGNGLVCAHWSRLAYKDHGGPHADWGTPSNWRNVPPSQTVALTVPDMIDRLIRDVRKSAGRLARLPREG